jgi:hypothetical protein
MCSRSCYRCEQRSVASRHGRLPKATVVAHVNNPRTNPVIGIRYLPYVPNRPDLGKPG